MVMGATLNEAAAFLSYAREDFAIADRLVKACRDWGLFVFQDIQNLTLGEPWRPALLKGIKSSRCLVVLLSPDSAASDEVLAEIKEAEALQKPIIPVLIRGRFEDIDGPVVERLTLLHCLDAVGDRGTIGYIRPLLRALKRHSGKMAPVISFSNLKGGVGKTTLAAQLSSAIAAKDRYSILMIDLDPQANLTQLVIDATKHAELVDEDQSVLSLFEKSLVYGDPSPRSPLTACSLSSIERPELGRIATRVGNSKLSELAGTSKKHGDVYIVPGQFELVKYTLPTAAQALPHLHANFARAINEARKDYDAVIIDLNPSSSFMIQCALSHSTHVVCPIKPDIYSVQGLDGLKKLIASAFALAAPPQIIAVLNAIPSWEDDFLEKVETALSDDAKTEAMTKDRKIGKAVKVIRRLLQADLDDVHLVRTHVPDTPMLQAYSDKGDSVDFFRLAQHLFSGSYGARLSRRLAEIADDVVRTTGLDALDDTNPGSPAKEA